MPEISLTQGKVALVDDEDYAWLSRRKWTAMRAHTGKYLAIRGVKTEIGWRLSYMAREIMGLIYGDPLEVDHRNHDTLDNRRKNLRIVTGVQNRRNQPSRGGTSRFVGVTWDPQRRRWRSQIQVDTRGIFLGRYPTEEAAAMARDAYVIANETGHALNSDLYGLESGY